MPRQAFYRRSEPETGPVFPTTAVTAARPLTAGPAARPSAEVAAAVSISGGGATSNSLAKALQSRLQQQVLERRRSTTGTLASCHQHVALCVYRRRPSNES